MLVLEGGWRARREWATADEFDHETGRDLIRPVQLGKLTKSHGESKVDIFTGKRGVFDNKSIVKLVPESGHVHKSKGKDTVVDY